MFYKTLQIASKTTAKVRFIDSSLAKSFDYFSTLVEQNKSFCIFPFIELLVNYDYTTVCCRSLTPVTKLNEFENFQEDKNYQDIRNKMIQGIAVPNHCNACYQLESQGMISARQQETVEWAQRLNISSIEELQKLQYPVYYEIRPSNKCNLLCRTCSPESSHLIEREYRSLKIVNRGSRSMAQHTTGFEIVNFDHAKKIYVAGGEPTVSNEFYKFINDCIKHKRTDIEILINTNGTKISDGLKQAFKHFSNLHFIFSIDGYADLNHYIRWPSKWQSIIENWKYLRSKNHKVVVNTTVSIYNIALLHHLCEYIDREFPNTIVHWNLATTPRHVSPYLYPNPDEVLESLSVVMGTNCYHNDLLFSSTVDGLYAYFKTKHQTRDLSEFFRFNDQLDRSRKINLAHYIPNLEKYRT